jgi:hypothetical protein
MLGCLPGTNGVEREGNSALVHRDNVAGELGNTRWSVVPRISRFAFGRSFVG